MGRNSYLTAIILCVCFAAAFLPPSAAFQSDELLVDDEEFEGAKPPEPEYPASTKSSGPSARRRVDRDAAAADSKVQFTLEHALGSDGGFSPAGIFTARLKTSSHGGQILTKLRFSRNALTEKEKEIFQELLEKDDFYQIRVPSNVLNPGENYVVSSVKARCLPRLELEEHFVIHMEGVNVLAVNYGSPSSCPYPRILKLPLKWSFNSHAVLKNGELAPRKPSFSEEALRDENVDGEGVKPPERSFWSKYWMYLIPLGLIVMNAITQAMNMAEEPAAGASGQSASQPLPSATQRAANPGVRRR
ncbi:ER membrane protein complex subunit 10 [Nymphaea thermarum]|nr:ER membrane protein complex subunit 10 [Nymphaea thermarum]